MNDRERREAAMRRLLGPSADTRKVMEDALGKVDDWTAVCHRCGEHLEGPRAALLAHKCKVP